MGRRLPDGRDKPVYYTPGMLTDEETSRFFQFNPPLSQEQLVQVKQWCKENITNFALIDEDYIFFTLKSEHDKFIQAWHT